MNKNDHKLTISSRFCQKITREHFLGNQMSIYCNFQCTICPHDMHDQCSEIQIFGYQACLTSALVNKTFQLLLDMLS